MLKGTLFLSVEEVKAKTTELLNSRTENGEHYVKKSLWSQERKMERVKKKMKPEIIYSMKGMDRADQLLYHPCCKYHAMGQEICVHLLQVASENSSILFKIDHTQKQKDTHNACKDFIHDLTA